MTKDTTTMPDWVLIEAAKRLEWKSGMELRSVYNEPGAFMGGRGFHAVADLILKHEQPPVDRKLVCAREAAAQVMDEDECESAAKSIRAGEDDKRWTVSAALRAIELWEAGHGK